MYKSLNIMLNFNIPPTLSIIKYFNYYIQLKKYYYLLNEIKSLTLNTLCNFNL